MASALNALSALPISLHYRKATTCDDRSHLEDNRHAWLSQHSVQMTVEHEVSFHMTNPRFSLSSILNQSLHTDDSTNPPQPAKEPTLTLKTSMQTSSRGANPDPNRFTPLMTPRADLKAEPNANAQSSDVWWSSIWRSPWQCNRSDQPECFARAWNIYIQHS